MTFKEYLVSQGLTDQQADAVVAGMGQNKFFLSGEDKIDERYSKLKTQHEQTEADLTAANKLVNDLQKANTDNTELQSKVTEYQTKITELEAERTKDRVEAKAREYLSDAVDVDYALFKLGALEPDAKGEVKDLENRVKALRESTPSMFKEEPKPDGKGGYVVVDNKLGNLNRTQAFDLSKMSAAEINANWDAIKAQTDK